MPFEIDFWHWWMLGVALIIIEVLAPSFFALWMGIAALFTGLALLLFPLMSWEYQVLLFAILSVASIVLWRQYYLQKPIETDQPSLNKRGAQYVGRIVTLQNPIVDGQGKIKIDDSIWKVTGADCEAGTQVKIIALDNVVFTVEQVD